MEPLIDALLWTLVGITAVYVFVKAGEYEEDSDAS